MSFNTSENSNTSADTSIPDVNMRELHISTPATTHTTVVVDAAVSPNNNHNNNNNNNNNNNGQKATSATATQGTRYGKCKWFNVAKGWGFVTPNDGGQEVFVHQSVIQMSGFRSLAEQEDVEFECKITERGLEATRVSGREGIDCNGSTFRPRTKKRFRRVRCYNCGEFANHIASKCQLGPQPKRCHLCKKEDHLFADCPNKQTQATGNTSGTSAETETEAELNVT